jgi:DNA-directed RNA polymerase specialized sigma24 family protein
VIGVPPVKLRCPEIVEQLGVGQKRVDDSGKCVTDLHEGLVAASRGRLAAVSGPEMRLRSASRSEPSSPARCAATPYREDVVLAIAVADGEEDGVQALVEREGPSVFRTCYRILARLGRVDDAEDVAQEQFVTACQAIGSYRGERPLGAWLARIASRRVIGRFRQRPNKERPEGVVKGVARASVPKDPLRQTRHLIVRFLPYTTKARLPQHRWLVRADPRLPPAWWLLGGQALYVGERR